MNASFLGTVVDRSGEQFITKVTGANGAIYFVFRSPSPSVLENKGKFSTLTEARTFCGIERAVPVQSKLTLPKSSYPQNRDGYRGQAQGRQQPQQAKKGRKK